MPRTKGSKNKPKVTKDYASQIAEKQETIASLTAEIAFIQKVTLVTGTINFYKQINSYLQTIRKVINL